MEEILLKIAEHAPTVAILIWVVIQKNKEIKELKKDNKEQSELMREKDEKVIKSLTDQNEVSNKFIEYINGKEEKKKR